MESYRWTRSSIWIILSIDEARQLFVKGRWQSGESGIRVLSTRQRGSDADSLGSRQIRDNKQALPLQLSLQV